MSDARVSPPVGGRLTRVSTVLETARLILRPFTVDDFDAFAAMYADPRVTQFVTEDGKSLSRFAAWRAFAGIVGHWALRGFGLFAVTERTSGAFIGRIGPWDPEGWPDFEIGWALRPECWGHGYATEAVKRCIEYAFRELDRSHLSSFIAPENSRSIHVAERVGERLEGETRLPHMPDRKVLRYGLSRPDWHRRHE